MIRLWEQFIPFLDYGLEIRTVICFKNAIESLNTRYLVIRSLDQTV